MADVMDPTEAITGDHNPEQDSARRRYVEEPDPIEQVIEDMMARKDDPAIEEARRRRHQELAAEGPQVDVKELTRPSHSVWTLRAMRERRPAKGDLYGDGGFLFEFDAAALQTEYVAQRFEWGIDHFNDKGSGRPERISFLQVLRGYADILYEALKGGSWPVREEVTDRDGNVVRDENGEPQTVPVPITRENVSRLTWEQINDFIEAMNKAVRGEASGQP